MSAEYNNVQLARLKNAIADAYEACNEKDATIPSAETIANLAGCIRSIQNITDDYINKAQVTHFATDVVKNVTAGMKLSVTGITDEKTGEPFEVKGVLGFLQPAANMWAYPHNHAASIPATFAFVRDKSRGFGVAMACHAQTNSTSSLREVRLNTDIGGLTNQPNDDIVISGNSFYYKNNTTMYGLIAADRWRWVAWG